MFLKETTNYQGEIVTNIGLPKAKINNIGIYIQLFSVRTLKEYIHINKRKQQTKPLR